MEKEVLLKFVKKQNVSLARQYLKEKSEYGFNASEYGFCVIACDNAEILADRLNLNSLLAKSLTMMLFNVFPVYGHVGIDIIMEYLNDNSINISVNQLSIEYTKYDLFDSGIHLFDGMKKYIDDLFLNPLNTRYKEVKIAYVCYKLIQIIKPVYNESIDKFNKVEEEMFKKLVDECAKYNDVLWLDEFVNLEVPLVESYLSEDEKENYIYSIQKVVDSEYETDFVEYIDINLDINKKKILNAVLSFIMNGYIYDLEDEDEEY